MDGKDEKGLQKAAATGPALEAAIASEQAVAAQPAELLSRAVWMAIALLAAVAIAFWSIHSLQPSDPYVQSVLQLAGNPDRGKDIFVLNCATCHGLEADGEVGPDLNGVSERKSRAAIIKQVISGQTPPMPQFQPNEKDMADLLSFLETL